MFSDLLDRAKWFCVEIGVEKKIVEPDGSFQVVFDRDYIDIKASNREIAINEVRKLVNEWKGIYENENAYIVGAKSKH